MRIDLRSDAERTLFDTQLAEFAQFKIEVQGRYGQFGHMVKVDVENKPRAGFVLGSLSPSRLRSDL